MADYYTHFSCLLDVGTPENAARALDLYNALADDNAAEDPPSEGFLLSIQPEHGGTQLWMRDDVTGDPEHVVHFVKRCAAEFGLSGLWGFQYANSCSKPRNQRSESTRHVGYVPGFGLGPVDEEELHDETTGCPTPTVIVKHGVARLMSEV